MASRRRSVAVIVSDRFHELEFWYPVLRLREEGVEVTVVGCEGDGAHVSKLGYPVVPNVAIVEASPGDYDAIVLPSGAATGAADGSSPLASFLGRINGQTPILAASGEGIVALAAASLIGGTRVAAPNACAKKVESAGATVEAAGVAVDGSVVSCKTPDDLPAFFASIMSLLEQHK